MRSGNQLRALFVVMCVCVCWVGQGAEGFITPNPTEVKNGNTKRGLRKNVTFSQSPHLKLQIHYKPKNEATCLLHCGMLQPGGLSILCKTLGSSIRASIRYLPSDPQKSGQVPYVLSLLGDELRNGSKIHAREKAVNIFCESISRSCHKSVMGEFIYYGSNDMQVDSKVQS